MSRFKTACLILLSAIVVEGSPWHTMPLCREATDQLAAPESTAGFRGKTLAH